MTRPLPAAVVSGQPVTRVDGRLKVTGKALYAADNPAPDLVYAALVCSTVARGSVERIDPAAAVRDRDVLRVLTDFGGVKLPYDIRQVSCFGQPVAVVVATTLEAAMHGASLVEVRYRPGRTADEYRCAASRTEAGQQNARLRPRQRRRRVAERRGGHRSALLDHAQQPQPDGDPGDRRQLGRRSAHRVGQGAEHQRGAEGLCRRVRCARRQGAGDLTVRRRRVRQRGHHVAAPTARRLRGQADATAGQTGADPQAVLQRHRLPARPAVSAWRSAPTGRAASAPSCTRRTPRPRGTTPTRTT